MCACGKLIMMEQQLIILFILSLSTLISACNYQNVTIVVDRKLLVSNCSNTNKSLYQCASINEMFDLLRSQTCCSDSTGINVNIKPGSYKLTSPYTLKNLCNIHFNSSSNDPAIIECGANADNSSDIESGLVFDAVRNLTIKHLILTGCGIEHSSAVDDTEVNSTAFRCALLIQNSFNIFLYNVNISNSNGIGLSFFDTNGIVNITKSFFINNFMLNSTRNTNITSGGGGVYVEITECVSDQIICNPLSNCSHNKHSIYLIENCKFENNTAVSFINQSHDATEHCNLCIDKVHFGKDGGLSVRFDGQARNNLVTVSSSIFTSNVADGGGALIIQNRNNASCNSVMISKCSFIGNSANF